ncbi:MAG: ATP-binding protein [Candidatus Tectomicrobia bacterium]|uniref:ATP-binding protein n=1 Tax=Tectimicrobiota bacterium TaxID=2528274 RepID=A0A938B4I0_UNCTE|nr:ATP-binding protein [Candidatus Tectomicrobia bacterium]
MRRYFNTAGPCQPERHYFLPPERRLTCVRSLIERHLFFVLHAPRQTGKTTLLNTLAYALNGEGQYTALVIDVEFLQRTSDVEAGNLALLASIARESTVVLPAAEWAPDPTPWQQSPLRALHDYLRAWSIQCPKPVVLFLDEIDSLRDDLLISVLRQLRMGYSARPAPFIASLALVGLRDVRDYRANIHAEQDTLGSASPFNIKSDSLTLRNFTASEVHELYAQHTAATGQVFQPAALDLIYALTRGQPWLVNALARQMVEVEVPEATQAITPAHVEAAREALILRRDTHLDSLAECLREARVRRVIEPILAGSTMAMDTLDDDLVYVRDLGLIETTPHLAIANPIYTEVIPRSLTSIMQANITHEGVWYTRQDGSLDMLALLRAFQTFFAEHSEAWLQRFAYQEAGPHLILMVFLQRVINHGGRIQREFAVGSGRADVLVEWQQQRYVLELKLWRSERTIPQGIAQLSRYVQRLGEREGYLVVFDRRAIRSWEEKLFEQEHAGPEGQRIHVFGV